MKILRLIPCGLLAVIALLWFPSSSGAQGSGQPACGCKTQDKTDLESRIKQVEAAMKEYDALVSEWERREKSAGESLMLNDPFRTSVQGSVNFKMSVVRDPNARSYGADTNPACEVTIDPAATPCLRPALQDHEAVHKKVCDANKSPNPFSDFRSKQRVVDYMKEEKAGYQKERDRLMDELNRMKQNCPQLTQLDPSTQQQLQQFFAQRERVRSANNRLQLYGKALN